MNKSLAVFGMAAALSCAAMAAQNDALLVFSTPGPDTYADGTTVLDGECYALVWLPKSSSAIEVSADGSASGGEVVLTAPVAKGGHCPGVMFQIPASDVEEKYSDGTWGVYLLDTRRWSADGSVAPAGLKPDGTARLVNASGSVSGAKVVVSAGSVSSFAASGASSASAVSTVPVDAPKAEITAIRILGGRAFVTVRNTAPYLQYGLTAGATPGTVTERVDAPQTGSENGEEIVLVAPASGNSGFFKLDRR